MSQQFVGSRDDAVVLDESADDVGAPVGIIPSKFIAGSQFDVESGLRESFRFVIKVLATLRGHGDVGEAGGLECVGAFVDERLESFATEFRESIEDLAAHSEVGRSTGSSKGQQPPQQGEARSRGYVERASGVDHHPDRLGGDFRRGDGGVTG